MAAQSARLRSGSSYVVTVAGTGSLWGDAAGGPVDCGAPESAPISTPSPGRPAVPATVDAAIVFAAPRGVPFLGGFACVDAAAPRPPAQAALRMGTGGVLAGAVPIGGQPSAPAPGHTYAYAVTGRGRPLQFQYADPVVNDNSGVLTITIRSARTCRAIRCTGGGHPHRRMARRAVALPCIFPALPAANGRPADLELCR